MVIVQGEVLERLTVLPPDSLKLLIVIPGEGEDILMEDLIEATYRVLVKGGEVIVARSLPDAFELL